METKTGFNNFFERGQFNHCSLFSGIGGFDLAAQWVGWNNVFQVEKDEWCRKVLQKNFPEAKRYGDIKEFNAKEYAGTIDIISGGFPCQPFSVAGKQKGKSDDRYLWEEMLRVVSEIKAPVIVGENVTGIIGMALDTVLSDLEAQNYTTETYIIPACGKNAWHRRDRVWIVAYSNRIRWQDEQKENGQPIHNGNGNSKVKEQSRGSSNAGLANQVIFFPTPQANDNRDRGNAASGAVIRRKEKGKQIMLSQMVSITSGQLNPNWVEWLMGYPTGWTDLKDLETP